MYVYICIDIYGYFDINAQINLRKPLERYYQIRASLLINTVSSKNTYHNYCYQWFYNVVMFQSGRKHIRKKVIHRH